MLAVSYFAICYNHSGDTMNISALWHQAKSAYAYAYDSETLHILIRTAKDDWDHVKIIYGDAFDWKRNDDRKIVWDHDIQPMTKRYQTSMFDYYFIALKPKDLRAKYAFTLTKENDIYFYGTAGGYLLSGKDDLYDAYDLSEYFNYPFIHIEDSPQTPSWVQETTWYQIFPDRFCNVDGDKTLTWGKLPVKNNELYGGNLKGITSKLPYIKRMGFTGIYLNPIFKSPSAHRYDTVDYYNIDPLLGTTEDFKTLLDESHKLNIKIMIDGVFNHVDFMHPWFLDVVENGEKSLYKDCFYIDKYPVANVKFANTGRPIQKNMSKLNYKTFAYSMHMPKWNTANPKTQEHLLGAISFWTMLGVDAWRLDVSNEISHKFLRQIMDTVRSIRKDVYVLGENMDYAMPWLQGDQMDAVMNYDMIHHVWKYLEHRITLHDFKDRINDYLSHTPKNIIVNMYNVVGTHDQIRIKKRLKDDIRREKQAFIWMFTSAGRPSVYYGDEIGMTGEQDPDNRRCMIWDEKKWDTDFQAFIQKLISLRTSYQSLNEADYYFLDGDVLAYIKHHQDEKILIILNQQDTKILHIPNHLQGDYINLLSNEKVTIHDKMALEAYDSYMLLRS